MRDKPFNQIDLEEYTENTNTGILFPPKDHSFENIKNFLHQTFSFLAQGHLFLLTSVLVIFWSLLLAFKFWPHTYKLTYTFSLPKSVFQNSLADHNLETHLKTYLSTEPSIIQAFQNQPNTTNRSYYQTFENHLAHFLYPTLSLGLTPPSLEPIPFKITLENHLKITESTPYNYTLTFKSLEPQILSLVTASVQTYLTSFNPEAFHDSLNTLDFNAQESLKFKEAAFVGLLIFGIFLSLALAILFRQFFKDESPLELQMTFPFPVLGLLPQLSETTSPTLLNDAFELLRTNISMQKSVYSFSSLTLVWPFEKSDQNAFITQLAADFGKMSKKVLVIETTPKTLTQPYLRDSQKGLSDLSVLIKQSLPQSDQENEIFWKMYEFVFGTEDKFYCMPYGQTQISPEELFETDNFKRILDVLKKHFSLLILNAPEISDPYKTLSWTTVNDATLLVANYTKHSSVAHKDILKTVACAQKFLLGGVLLDVPLKEQNAKIINYNPKWAEAL